MNAFRIMKMLNELSATAFPKQLIQDCAAWLWKEISKSPASQNPKSLLVQYREFDKSNAKPLG
jgi:hypothetical protein